MFVKNKDMPIYSFKEFIPVVDPSSFVHPTATLIGNVIIGKKVYIGPDVMYKKIV
jgi:phenylacetic acid degradation protein